MSAVIVPIDEYLPPFDPAADRVFEEPAKVIMLPVIRVERSPFPKSLNEPLPSDCEP